MALASWQRPGFVCVEPLDLDLAMERQSRDGPEQRCPGTLAAGRSPSAGRLQAPTRTLENMDNPPIAQTDRSMVPASPAKLALGAAAELLIASRIALLGYQVYRPLADDRGVDLLIDVGQGRHAAVQVKAVRHVSRSYVFMRKSTFALRSWMVLALVVYGKSLDDQPQVYFIPATEWRSPTPPLTSYDYVGGKSAPEYGLNVRKAWKEELASGFHGSC